jgi:2,4-dienoyl-CoA reductase-like NADH-dependent reductase (Old Yellow Enzyme family)
MTSNSSKQLFQPIKVGTQQLQHRIVLAPLTRTRADRQGIPTDLITDYYSQRATPGGLLIAEATAISSKVGRPKFAPGVYNQEQLAGWKPVVAGVHAKQGVIFQQLWHTGRTFAPTSNDALVSASAIPIPGVDPASGKPYPTPTALTIPEIKTIIQEFAQAAKNAIQAGFDGMYKVWCGRGDSLLFLSFSLSLPIL